jgi:serine protease Do
MSRRTVSRIGNAALCAAALFIPAAIGRAATDAPAADAKPAEVEQKTVFESIQEQVNTLFGKCRSAVVRVEARDKHGELAGTGFFIDPHGTLYTSWTVGGDESRDLVVCYGDKKYPAQRLVADFRCGVAILKVDAPTPFLPLGESRSLTVASPVLTIGYPMDLPLTPSFGMVGGFDLKYLGRYFATTHIRANVAVQRGQGGAPLMNMHGEVVGILISSLDQGSASFVLPIEAAEKVRRDFVRFGEVRPGWVGMAVGPAATASGGSTAEVQDILTDGPAAKAGVERGDILVKVGERAVVTPDDVIDASFFITAEDPLKVRLIREGKELDLQLTPSEPPVIKRSLLSPLANEQALEMETE